MTPGRGNVFGFVMNKRQGFFYPWPEPRSEKAAPAKMARLREIHRPFERALERAPQLSADVQKLRKRARATAQPPLTREERYRHLVSKLAGVEDLDHNAIWWRPEGLPSTQVREPQRPEPVHQEDHRREEREREALCDKQRLRRALDERRPYVVPVTLRPDLELATGAAVGAFEPVEPQIARVHEPHKFLGWDRRNRERS